MDNLISVMKSRGEFGGFNLTDPSRVLEELEADAAAETTAAGSQTGNAVDTTKISKFVRRWNLNVANKPAQMIEGDGTFCQSKVEEFVKSATKLLGPGESFAVISIIGPQSSGKSYLLNKLFDTKFDVMNATLGREQTTKGILVGRSTKPCALIMDVEGSDGGERGEENISFERQSALFALTVSDLMMVNMWQHDIGREQGAGIPLLKTVFQERVKLDPGRTKMLVVIRDYDEETPLDWLKNAIETKMEDLWKSVHDRPDEPAVRFSDYIQVMVEALPHNKFLSRKFGEGITKLRELIAKEAVAGLRHDKVTASGFSISAKNIWETIRQNKQLDLPGNRVMVSTYFCDNYRKECLEAVVIQEGYPLLNEVNSSDEFIVKLESLLDERLKRYDTLTKMYDETQRATKRKELEEGILQLVESFARNLLNEMRLKFVCESTKNVAAELSKADDPEKEVDALVHTFLELFTKSCEGLSSRYKSLCSDSYITVEKELKYRAKATALDIKEQRVKEELDRARQEIERTRLETVHAKEEVERLSKQREEDRQRQENYERKFAELERATAEAARARKEAENAMEEAKREAQEAKEQAGSRAQDARSQRSLFRSMLYETARALLNMTGLSDLADAIIPG
ncbi:protein ROOT HAIR DEFECTIVE 3-like isoform X1 [Typha angustifolia]|uniref:protein ROOT HAIR DEFECTIVE 3-like isoform X1 n=2 Tax=Typha angustifolia TaxID=59011 RepID=UPI003C30E4DD